MINKTEWIPVKTRLPAKNGEVLITVDLFGSTKIVQIASYVKEGKRFCSYDGVVGVYDISNVIAWMPLPKPYEKDI